MTSESPTPSSESDQLDGLEARVRRLQQSVAEQHKNFSRKRTRYLVAGGALTLISCVTLGSLTSMLSELDAHAVTEIGRQQFEKHLPAGRANLAGYLTTEAPRVVRHGLRTLLDDLLPELRTTLVDHLDERFQRVVEEGESVLSTEMQKVIATSKENLDIHYPDLSEKERLERLVAGVGEMFCEKTETLLEAMYPQYEAEITRVHGFVTGLATSDEELLSPKEQIQKELIRTLLRLIALEHSKAENPRF